MHIYVELLYIPDELTPSSLHNDLICSLFPFSPHLIACWILVLQPGIEHVTDPAVEVWSLNHLTTRKFPYLSLVTVFDLKPILSYISIGNFALFWLPFAANIFIPLFSVYVCP